MIQYSQQRLDELVEAIYNRFRDHFVVGEEVHACWRDQIWRCKVLEVFNGGEMCRVEWVGSTGTVSENGQEQQQQQHPKGGDGQEIEQGTATVENRAVLFRKRHPLPRSLLKAFIRDSADVPFKNAPWILKNSIAQKHRITTEPPQWLRELLMNDEKRRVKVEEGEDEVDNYGFRYGGLYCDDDPHGRGSALPVNDGMRLKRKVEDSGDADDDGMKRRRLEGMNGEAVLKTGENGCADAYGGMGCMSGNYDREGISGSEYESSRIWRLFNNSIRYPIEDTLVHPGKDDPEFTKRLPPSDDFILPMECVGDTLMIWTMVSCFGRSLHLSPFPLEDLEKALEYREGEVSLLAELHAALLRLVVADMEELRDEFVKKRKKRQEVSVATWADDVSDWLEITKNDKLSGHAAAIRQGEYSSLPPTVKVAILTELCNLSIETAAISAERSDRLLDSAGLGKLNDARKQQLKAETEVMGMGVDGDQRLRQREEELKEKEDRRRQLADINTERKRMEQERLARQRREEQFQRDCEKYFVRMSPLGRDRDRNRYWFFQREGRVFVENELSAKWGYYSAKEEVDALYGSLNPKGIRERALRKQLEKHYNRISGALQRRSREIAQRFAFEETGVRRSTRVRSAPRRASFLSYVNKFR
ncbi:hypothetical protein CBR_g15970 [Chara braunii]|uniref:DDT domain-containing protein n=1 Tax=Chara braunii TaxID=69332 RepID=A0A388JSQ2_CHABU|nr:hypothetical protein CBR_g15970 [Chara braunii]|eukprot:GBG60849.1 hypothetical protein CBR_g15970 [Chara braunii]